MGKLHETGSARWRRLRLRVLERDGYRCVRCERAGRLEVDHILPLSEGGKDTLENLRALCRTCHLERHATPDGIERRGFRSMAAALAKAGLASNGKTS